MGSFVDSCFECFATVLPASKGFYSRGYGDLDHAMELRGELMTQLAKGEEPALIDVEWSGKEEPEDSRCFYGIPFCRPSRIATREGQFLSPASNYLPKESQRVHMRLYRPADIQMADVKRIALLLPATGDQFYWYREKVAMELAKEGVASLVPIFPLYGPRRPAHQTRHLIGTIEEFMIATLAGTMEAASLCSWAAHEYPNAAICLTGVSMGGTIAVTGAISSQQTVACCACIATPTAETFVKGVLSTRVAWGALKGASARTHQEEQDKLSEVLGRMSIAAMLKEAALSPSGRPRLGSTVQLIAQGDIFVTKEEAADLQEMLQGLTPEAAYRVVHIDGGHLSTTLFEWSRTYVPGILQAFGLLEDQQAAARSTGGRGAAPGSITAQQSHKVQHEPHLNNVV